MPDDRRARFVAAALARDAVARIAERLGAEGIPLMPLKGALLQQLVYADASDRAISDVDVLVPEEAFARAGRVLGEAGYRPLPQQRTHERTYRPRGSGVPVDLHRRLFPRWRARLDTPALFARGRRDRVLFGAEVTLPDPRDLLAHLVGHAAQMHADERTSRTCARDIELLVARHAPPPEELARHLDRAGLGRAARYALQVLGTSATRAYCQGVLAGLAPDPLGRVLARAALAAVRGSPRRSRRGTVPVHLLAPSLAGAGASLADAALERACAALLGRPALFDRA